MAVFDNVSRTCIRTTVSWLILQTVSRVFFGTPLLSIRLTHLLDSSSSLGVELMIRQSVDQLSLLFHSNTPARGSRTPAVVIC